MGLYEKRRRFWEQLDTRIQNSSKTSLRLAKLHGRHGLYFRGVRTKALGPRVYLSALTNWKESKYGVGLFLEGAQAPQFFEHLKRDQVELQSALGCTLEFKDNEESSRHRIHTYQNGLDLEAPPIWLNQHKWMITMADRFVDIFSPRLSQLRKTSPQ